MRLMEKNRKLIFYSIPLPPTPILDEDGYDTGEWNYDNKTDPLPLFVNHTRLTGEAIREKFGIFENYHKVVFISNKFIPIKEDTLLWVEQLDTSKAHDYIVKRKAIGLNGYYLGINKVDVNE